ncbi:ATP-binding protein [Oceanicoccus sp. KOV_DT_Chl]|uniref:ATP-binding protein n=1 Tax=Oceanicoccus sp. KOV_DT_Chl TaxID=1904639 RepID=UPI000C7DF20C|nr:ATP-binding protein [Oceanicoccus sp. KOV_DT_Chl]
MNTICCSVHTISMKLQYSKNVFIIVSLLVLTGMSFLGYFRLNLLEQNRVSALNEMAQSVVRRVSKTTAPTIWSVFKKSTGRHYEDSTASALLDFELEENPIVAIIVYGNFGHTFMGRVKDSSGNLVTYNKIIHSKAEEILSSKMTQGAIKQGSMTIGSVAVYYSEKNWNDQFPINPFVELLDLLIITVLVIAILYFALRMSQAKSSAEEANAIKGQFLANMSHEIRTPMNAILGLLELLRKSKLDAEQKRFLDVMHSSSFILMNIINDVLDISKIEAEKLDIDIHEVDLIELVNYLTLAFKEQAEKKTIDYTVNLAADVPRLICADDFRIKQILSNLITNAIKFTLKGSVTVEITNKGIEDGRTILCFDVVDTGIGISAEHQQKLFQAFTQAESTTTRRFGGTGLGLAIALRLAHLMGGNITLESAKGAGSKFHYQQPVEIFHSANQPSIVAGGSDLAPLSMSPRQAVNNDAIKILVVEDNPTNRMVIAKQLESLGHNADFSNDGIAGLAAWERGAYDLIFSDCHMPRMDGYAMTEAIREREAALSGQPRVPIIALTANVMPADNDKCIKAGMDDVVKKPCSAADLNEKITSWLPLVTVQVSS